jgi:hypothetical protein
MRQAHRIAAVIGLVLLIVAGSYGQSLGDVARAQRQKQANDAPAARKVITNEDLPEDPEESTSPRAREHHAAPTERASNDVRAGQQWKAKIKAQENSIASLQSQIDRLNSSIHFVQANRYYNGVQYNERQVEKQEQVQRMQEQLDAQKKQLEDMQESARKAGLGSSVYEP